MLLGEKHESSGMKKLERQDEEYRTKIGHSLLTARLERMATIMFPTGTLPQDCGSSQAASRISCPGKLPPHCRPTLGPLSNF
jgi:hypothetical protein